MNQSRWKSPILWAAVAAQILSVLVLVGVIGEDVSNTAKAVIAAILELLVAVGVMNNPTCKNDF